jgi:hypothetical protein
VKEIEMIFGRDTSIQYTSLLSRDSMETKHTDNVSQLLQKCNLMCRYVHRSIHKPERRMFHTQNTIPSTIAQQSERSQNGARLTQDDTVETKVQ